MDLTSCSSQSEGGTRSSSSPAITSVSLLASASALALPDRFGNRIIDLWLARHGRTPDDFTPLERLCYVGSRGMGAMEFKPAIGPRTSKAIPIEVSELTQLASDILRQRAEWAVNLKGARSTALNTIFRVSTSAGGNRAKAVIAWNPATHEVRSGQVPAPEGFEPWILKFDGVDDKSLGDPQGFGRIEYAYHRMAVAAGIQMSDCRLLEEGGRAHFMTRRFDRTARGEKIHMQSLCAIAHYDFNAAGEYLLALEDFQRAAILARQMPNSTTGEFEAQTRIAEAKGLLGAYQDAVLIYQAALDAAGLRGPILSSDTTLASDLRNAEAYAIQYDYRTAFNLYRKVMLDWVTAVASETYSVQAGDYLPMLARHYNTTVSAILAANGMTAQIQLEPNTELNIPTTP